MKGGAGGWGGCLPAKRRWRGLVAGVLCLVILSMLVPLGFLLGLHNGFHSTGYVSEQQSSASGLGGSHTDGISIIWNHSKGDPSNHIDDLVGKLGPTFPKDVARNFTNEPIKETSGSSQQKKGIPVPAHAVLQPHPNTNNTRVGGAVEVIDNMRGGVDESRNLCELRFGSYCIWRQQHKEEMKDSMVRKLKDQLFVARAYYPTIAKLPAQNKLSRDLKQNIQELERVLSESTTDDLLPPQIEKKLKNMEAAIARAKSFPVDCNNVDKKLRQIFDMTEEEANFHMKQSAFLYQVVVQTLPKSLHCLSMRLTVEYFKSPLHDMEHSLVEKYSDRTFLHFVIFSNNVLASSVVINSTVMHAKESMNQVFHVLTDGQNYFAMKLWFLRNTYKDATVQVLNIERHNMEYHDKATLLNLSLPVEFRVAFRNVDNPHTAHYRTQYISIFSHSHYLLPKIFQNLEKVVVLDDDVVVQQDLSALWSLNMRGKVNGAIQLCSVRLGHLKSYLGENGIDTNSCAWMSGLNIIDLVRWRELDLTETYRRLVREQVSRGDGSIEAVALRSSLLTFRDLIYALDGEWALSGLGHDYELDIQAIKKAPVLHYNGNMKPWLELGIPKYRGYWKKFLNHEDQFLSECNVNP